MEAGGIADGLPCKPCPEQLLSRYLGSAEGRMMLGVFDLDFALQMGFRVTLADITYPEFLILRQFCEERMKYETEQIEKRSRRGSQ